MEPAKLNQLDKQQKFKFYNFVQHRIPIKLPNAFIADVKIYK